MSNYFNGNGTIGFTCDVCGRELNSCSVVNGMKFCAKCYQETFGKDNQQNEIQELKQQLAEKQNTINEINKELVQAVHDWKALCAEKDKEIERLKSARNSTYEQVKIWKKEFAIQELEKVKQTLHKGYYEQVGKYYYAELGNIEKVIDNQIKKLKGE